MSFSIQALYVSRSETLCTLHLFFTKNAKNVFVFGGSLSNDGFRVAIFIEAGFALHIRVVAFVFRILFHIILLHLYFLITCIGTE